MPYSSGTYTLPSNSFAVPVTGTTISSSAATTTFADFATAFTTCVLKDGTQTITANIPMATFILTGLGAGSAAGHSLRYQQLFTTSAVTLLGAMDWVTGANIASGATVNLTTATGNAVHVTGTTTITAVTLGSGMWRLVIFDDALTLTHHATDNNLPGGANITTAANDRALYWSDGTTVYCMAYEKASGNPVLISGFAATQAEQETGSATTVYVSPGRQQFHASAAKGWVKSDFAGAINASYNVTSITDVATGRVLVTWATDFSGIHYCSVATAQSDSDINTTVSNSVAPTATATEIRCYDQTGGLADGTNLYCCVLGDQ